MKFATATSNSPSANGSAWTSLTRASTPRPRASSTICSDWSTATTSTPAAWSLAPKSPGPQPTSSARRGPSAATASNATSSTLGPVRRDQRDLRTAKRDGSAYSRRTASGSACRSFFIRGDLVPDLLERAPDEPRNVHLRDADLLRDLRLREPVEEAELEDLPLALVEDAEARREHRAILRHLVLVLLAPDRLERVEILLTVAAAARGERERRVRAAGLERLEHRFLFGAGRLRELRDRRRAAELHGQLLHQPRELHV